MAGFDNGVSAPSGLSYAAPLLNFQQFANWPKDYYQGVFNSQQVDQNKQEQELTRYRIDQAKQQQDIAQTFQGGLPRAADGSIDYAKAVAMLAQRGDVGALWNGADAMLQQSATKMSPLLSGGGAAPGPQGEPQSVQARPLPPAGPGPQGDSGTGTIASLVTDKLPAQDATTGQTIGKIAQVLGVDPNAPLTPGQAKRAQVLLSRYAPSQQPAGAGGAVQPAPAPDAASFRDRFAAADGGGRLPPSANAVSPAPQPPPAQPRPQPAQISAPSAPQPAQAPAQGQPQPQQAAPQGQPITPQVPLPNGYKDPQQAILALRAEAARLSANPRAAGQVRELENWASRIEESVKPVAVTPNTTLLDPRSGQPIYQGNQPTMSPQAINDAAERYLQSGQFPPNMGRGVQGTADRNAILDQANQLAEMRGINTADLPSKWQQFKGQQVAIQRFTSGPQGNTIRSFNVLVDHLDTLNDAAAALKNGDNRMLNRFKQTWAANTGGTAPTNFDGVKALVGDEIVKAVVGSAGALADREEVKKDLDRASSPQQLAELVEKYKKLALGQLHGLQKQYETSTGQKNFNDMLLPGTLKALGGGEGKASEAKTSTDGWTVVTAPNGKKARIQEITE